MKKTTFMLFSLSIVLGTPGFATAQTIKLSGRKDVVLPSSDRSTVLEVAKKHLGQKDIEFLNQLERVENPYAFKLPPVERPVVVGRTEAVPEPVQEVAVVYDDASVLKVIASSFAQQVRGTLARGQTNYIQLQGGKLLKAGTRFPARLPGVQNVSYTVTLTDITPQGYTLQLGESKLTLPYTDVTTPGSSAVKYQP